MLMLKRELVNAIIEETQCKFCDDTTLEFYDSLYFVRRSFDDTMQNHYKMIDSYIDHNNEKCFVAVHVIVEDTNNIIVDILDSCIYDSLDQAEDFLSEKFEKCIIIE